MADSSLKSINDKYQIKQTLGQGASGVIYLAKDENHQEFAIKCLKHDADHKNQGDRLKHEFAILRELTHPGIAGPREFGVDVKTNQFFIATEYVRGHTLDVALQNATHETALDLFHQALLALAYMHRRHVFHCDLKPQNILVRDDGVLKIIDFDIATRDAIKGGSPAFTAPEVLLRLVQMPNPKTDLYSLGAAFYDGLTGQKPYPANSLAELQHLLQTHTPEVPSKIKANLPVMWDDILAGLIQANPSHRYATATAVLQQIMPLIDKESSQILVDDIAYRLREHGFPIGRDDLIAEAKNKSSSSKTIWVVDGGSGTGTSYVLEEFKAIAQLQGEQCYEWNTSSKQIPDSDKFVWFIDNGLQDRDVLAKLSELYFTGKLSHNWILIGGMSSLEDLPHNLQEAFQKHCRVISLIAWDKIQTEIWLRDVFQEQDIPAYLTEQIFKHSGGNQKNLHRILSYYLDENLIVDEQGQWHKNLYHPTPLFEQTLIPPADHDVASRRFIHLAKTEQDLITNIALSYQGLPLKIAKALTNDDDLLIATLEAQNLIAVDDFGNLTIIDATFKRFVANQMAKTDKEKRHDVLLSHYQRLTTLTDHEKHETRHHQAHGSHQKLARIAWESIGLDAARAALWQTAYDAYTEALSHCDDTDQNTRFACLVERAKFVSYLQDTETAKAHLESLLREHTHLQEQCPAHMSRLYERLGLIAMRSDELTEAKTLFQKAITALGPEQKPLEQYLGLKNFIASTHLASGEINEAITLFEHTHQMALQNLSDEKRRILTNNDLAQAYLRAGQKEKAIAHWQTLIADYKNRDDKIPLARSCYQVAHCLLQSSEPKAAAPYLSDAAKALKGAQDFDLELRVHNALASLHQDDNTNQATTHYEHALHCAFKTRQPFTIAVVMVNMGFLFAENQDNAQAKHCLRQGLQSLQDIPDHRDKHAVIIRQTRLKLAQILLSDNEIKQAQEQLNRSKDLLLATPNSDDTFTWHLLQWQIFLRLKDKDKATQTKEILDTHTKSDEHIKRLDQALQSEKDFLKTMFSEDELVTQEIIFTNNEEKNLDATEVFD